MTSTTTSVPNWTAVNVLYDDLARVERRAPGSDAARDLESAISILLDLRCATSDPRYEHWDAIRRARFLRRQAARQRARAAARGGHYLTATRPGTESVRRPGSSGDGGYAEPTTVITPEAIVCAKESAREVVASTANDPRGRYAGEVLFGLRTDQTPANIASELGVSRRTVDRCIRLLRDRMAMIFAETSGAP